MASPLDRAAMLMARTGNSYNNERIINKPMMNMMKRRTIANKAADVILHNLVT